MSRVSPRNAPTSPRVSVVIAGRNQAHHLATAIESARGQEGIDLDIIVVDDASTDRSVGVVRVLGAEDSRIRLISQPERLGTLEAMNNGLSVATGEYVSLVSAGNALSHGCLARAGNLMEAYPEVGLVYGFAQEFSGVPHPLPARRESWSLWPGEQWIARVCERGPGGIYGPEAVFRRSVLDRLGGFDETRSGSATLDLWMRVAASSEVGRVNGPAQGLVRMDPDGESSDPDEAIEAFETRREAFDAFFSSNGEQLPNAATLRETARRTLAREALNAGVELAESADSDDRDAAPRFAALAEATWPAVVGTPLWESLQRADHRRRGRLTRFLSQGRAPVGGASRWERWRRFGT